METLERSRSSFNDRRGKDKKKKRLVFDFKVGDTRIIERYEKGKSNAYSKSTEEYIGSTVVRRIVLCVGHSTTFNQVFTKKDSGFIEYTHALVNKFAEGKDQVPIEKVAEEFQSAIESGYIKQAKGKPPKLTKESLEVLLAPPTDNA